MKVEIRGDIIPNEDKWIYEWFGLEATCPKDIKDLVDKANGEPLEVFINSGGGDVFSGVEIYDMLQRYAGKVTLHNIWAASAASVILCAGRNDTTPTGMVMIHNVSGGARGDYHVMDKTSDVLQTANKAVAAAYVAKTGKSEQEILDLMDKETWLTAQQAVDMGLIDEVYQAPIKMVASAGCSIPQEVIDKIRNTVPNPFKGNAGVDNKTLTQARLNFMKLKGVSN